MNTLQINYFLAAANHESFTKAADQYYISQPAMSRVIVSLERELGFSLFERSARKTYLTPAGKLFYAAFQQSRQLLSEATQMARAANIAERGEVFFGLLSGWDVSNFLPRFLTHFKEFYPNIIINTAFFDFKDLRNALDSGRVDAIMSIRDAITHMSHIKTSVVARSPRILLYAKKHPLGAKTTLTPVDFMHLPFFAVADEKVSTAALLAEYCLPYGFKPKVILVPNNDSLIAGVENLQGVAVVDSWSRVRSNASFGYLPLNSFNHIVLAWNPNHQNPILPLFIREITLVAQSKPEL